MIRSANAGPQLNRRTITFAIAAVLAIGTGVLTFSYLTSMNRNVSVAAAPRLIVVAQRDIPARATITLDMLAVARRPADAIDPDSLTAPATAVGSIARVSIPAGSAVTSAMIGRAFDTGLTERIPAGMRAISIPIDRVKGVANLIQAGDHVDVIALTRAEPGIPPRALTILKNIVVLAIGTTYETTGAVATPAPDEGMTTATLRVTPKQADLLALADVNTTLRLALREPKERTGPVAPDALVLTAPEMPVPVRSVPAPAAPAAAAPAPAPHRNAVEVIEGDQVAGRQMSARVVVVVGGKGGVGATTLTAAFARASVKRKQHVALVDGDLAARRSTAVVLDAVHALDAARSSGNIATAVVEDMTVVEMTSTIDGAFTIQPDDAQLVATTMLENHDVVFVDAPQPYAAALRGLVMKAHVFVLVVEPSLLGVTGARAVQVELAKFGVPASQIMFVTNARDGRTTASKREIESALQCDIRAEFGHLGDRRFPRIVEAALDDFAAMEAQAAALSPSMTVPIGDRRGRGRARRPDEMPAGEPSPAKAPVPISPARHEEIAVRDKLKSEIHAALSERIDTVTVSRGVDDATRMTELRAEIADVVGDLIAQQSGIGSAEDVAHLRQEIIDEALGLGPLEELLRDHSVTEIMVNGHGKIFVERAGKIELTAKRFSSDRHVRLIIERIVAPLGRRIDESQPMVDARLADGSRVNAIVEPLAIDGPTLTIRKFPERRMQAADLVRMGSITNELVDFLRAAVEARLNILVSGGTGSGKTTLLNVLSSFLPESERIVTIEDAAELSLAQAHVVRLESRPPNIQGAGEVRIRDLVKNALRMRPDRIIVGECRGGEALDMLQAMNTGHDGSLTTVHANTPRDALSRIETLVLMAGFDLPVRAIREQVAGALDMIVQIGRLRDGTRKVVSISEVVGLESDVVTMQEIAYFDQRGLDKDSRVVGDFHFTGVQPMCLKRFEEMGITYDVRQLAALPTAANW